MTIYGILTILVMTLVGGFVSGVVASNDIEEGRINGGFLTLILLIAFGLLLGLITFVTMGIYASAHAFFMVFEHTSATTSLSGSNVNSFNSLGDIILNIVYAIITIIISFILGILGGSLGVIFKERL
jgi:hypothetical protein